MSLCLSAPEPRACSGDMYAAVPRITPAFVAAKLLTIVGEFETAAFAEPSSKDPIGKRLALNELEHKESCLIRFFEIVNGSNVRMVQRRQHFGFTLETAHTIGITRKLVRKNLDCYLALQL